MLNCTDLECILHHHHYYAQLHHLTHGTHHVEDVSTDDNDGYEDIQGLLNDTDSELSGLSHLDAPNESLYMIGGVLIAMFLVGVIIILLAVTISKLRKREDSHHAASNTIHPVTDVILQQTTPNSTPNLGGNYQHNIYHSYQQQQLQVAATHASGQPVGQQQGQLGQQQQQQQQVVVLNAQHNGQFLWQFPPPCPLEAGALGTAINGRCQYNNDQDTLVQNLPSERPSFVRGFRKNLGGRWRRLVKRKPSNEMCGHIPAELKPQLKQIYVY